MVADSRFHAGRDPQAGMYPAEVVVREVKRNRGFQVIQFLAETQRQARETAHGLAHGQVLSFHKTCRNMARVGPSVPYLGYHFYHRCRRVSSSSVMLPVVAIQLYQLGEVSLSSKNLLDSATVESESVSRDLKAMLRGNAVAQTGKELVGRFLGSLSDHVARNQFCFCINGDENPSVAEFVRFAVSYVPFFLPNESPNFIRLNPLAFQISHLRVHQSYATFSGKNQEAHDCVTVQLRDALCASDGSSFKQQLNCQQSLIFRHRHRSEKSDVFFRKSLAAVVTTEALQPVSVLPELAAFVLASRANHVDTLQQAVAVCQGQTKVVSRAEHAIFPANSQTVGAI